MAVGIPHSLTNFHETCFDVGNVSFTFLSADHIGRSVVYESDNINNATHTHIFYEIFIVRTGRLLAVLSDDTVELSPYRALLLPPDSLHRMTNASADLDAYSVSFSFQKKHSDSPTDLYTEFCRLFGSTPRTLDKSEELADTMGRLISYQDSNRIEKWRLTSACFNEMVFICKEMLERHLLRGSSNAGYNSLEFRNYIIDDYLNTCFADNITLETLADTFYLTPQHINRIIRKNYGLPFRQHIIRLRVRYAKQLLTETNLRINRIAAMCGYDSQHGFYTVFEKAVGCTPEQYRKRYARNVVK